MCVQEEERQKLEKPDVAYLMAAGASSSSNNSNGKLYCKFRRKVGPKLDIAGFYVSHGNVRLTISSNSQVFGTGLLDGGLYKLELDDDFSRSLLSYNINENSTKTKTKRDLETSSMLWHQHLGHISRYRLSQLVKDGVLPSLNFTDFGTCVKCLKGKMTTTKKGATRSSNLLEIIYTDISGPYTIVHHATPNFTAPTLTQSGLTTTPNITENESTSTDQHQHNTSNVEPANQLRRAPNQ
ncbi:hypothetical protein E3N88_17915 [Mikania micrantha]|uniref:GAG-pre-integrase domain-containing protein n=1 Tax=Mikania micrantha TaxID=192012 RepID=A0A5N6NUJ1_9ASTR|nr:hypothetical protein E3N88_17915 [Mikania micrantha]